MIGEYGNDQFDQAPFKFERRVYEDSTYGYQVVYVGDDLYQSIKHKQYEEYYQFVTQNLKNKIINYHRHFVHYLLKWF